MDEFEHQEQQEQHTTQQRQMEKESDEEDAILNYVFNPGLQGLPVQPPKITPNDLGPPGPKIPDKLLQQLKSIELQGVRLAEDSKDYDGAIALFNQAIEMCPHYGSAYNNRAQAFLLKDDLDQALQDLNSAIKYGSGQQDVLKQAYTQRGIIYKKKGDDEQARRDFEMGAKLGHPFAKIQAVQLNPYAALCNKMLEQAMSQLMKPQPSKRSDDSKEDN